MIATSALAIVIIAVVIWVMGWDKKDFDDDDGNLF